MTNAMVIGEEIKVALDAETACGSPPSDLSTGSGSSSASPVEPTSASKLSEGAAETLAEAGAESNKLSESAAEAAERSNKANLYYAKKQSFFAKLKLHCVAVAFFIQLSFVACFTLSLRRLRRLCCTSRRQKERQKEVDAEALGTHIGMTYIDCSELEKNRAQLLKEIKSLLAKDVPVILRHVPKDFFDVLGSEKFNLAEDFPGQLSSGGYLVMDSWFIPRVGRRLQNLISDILFHRPFFMARFRGGYQASLAHIDSGATYNFYYVLSGMKRVTLIPAEHSHYHKLSPGFDSLFVAGSDDDENFGSRYPSYYKFELEAGDVLCFNNCALLHKFENVTGKEDIYTIRVPSITAACDEILRNDMFSYFVAVGIASQIMTRRCTREIKHV